MTGSSTLRSPEPRSTGALHKAVFDFSEGDKDQKDLLGGKGANLAEMVKLGFETDARQVLAEVIAENGVELEPLLGTMIALPRAAMTAGQIAEAAEFFSFGTNDLTQTTWGFSRDDVEAAFFSTYLEIGIFGVSPFEAVDVEGVGELVRIGVERGRATRPDLKVGVCGEHGGDPRLRPLLPPHRARLRLLLTVPHPRSPGSKPVGSRLRPQPVPAAADGATPRADPDEQNSHDIN